MALEELKKQMVIKLGITTNEDAQAISGMVDNAAGGGGGGGANTSAYGEISVTDVESGALSCTCMVNGYPYTSEGRLEFNYETDPPEISYYLGEFMYDESNKDPIIDTAEGANYSSAIIYGILGTNVSKHVPKSAVEMIYYASKAGHNMTYKFTL